jgi:hypothetical protein
MELGGRGNPALMAGPDAADVDPGSVQAPHPDLHRIGMRRVERNPIIHQPVGMGEHGGDAGYGIVVEDPLLASVGEAGGLMSQAGRLPAAGPSSPS